VDRKLALTTVTGAFVALLFVMVATADQAPLAQRSPTVPWSLPTLEFTPPTVPDTIPPSGELTTIAPSEPSRGWEIAMSLLQYAFTAAALVLAAYGARRAWQRRPRVEWRRRTPPPDFAVLDDIAAAIVADAEAQTATLRAGHARNAIVACWSRLEHLVVDAGSRRDPADTPAEFTERILAAHTVDGTALHELAALYREARFSTHDLGEPERAAAIEALERLHAGLAHRGSPNLAS